MHTTAVTILALGLFHIVLAAAPKIEFEQTVFDFGKLSQVESVDGTFTFKNAGDAILKVQKPSTSCGCTIADLQKDTLNPGETAELKFTLNFRGLKGPLFKSIRLTSNDPEKPTAALTIKAHYTPLYDVAPTVLQIESATEAKPAKQMITLTRTDGKPVQVHSIEASNPSIIATLEPGTDSSSATVRIAVEVRKRNPQRRTTDVISIFADEKTAVPVARVFVPADVGELAVSPQKLFWSITDPAKAKREMSGRLLTRRVVVRAAGAKRFELTNVVSSLNEVEVAVAPLPNGEGYDLTVRLSAVPAQSTDGTITFETSIPGVPRFEIPVAIKLIQNSRRPIVSVPGAPGTGKTENAADSRAVSPPPEIRVPRATP